MEQNGLRFRICKLKGYIQHLSAPMFRELELKFIICRNRSNGVYLYTFQKQGPYYTHTVN